jgi:4-amino-4-deoxy-L-arabinose transferase-like glycosyltransferase
MQSENLSLNPSAEPPASLAESQVESRKRFYNRPAFWAAVIVLAVFLIGFGVRMYDLTNQPLDFHPTRQLRGAIIARGMYYQMQRNADPELRRQAINFWYSTGQYEPSIIEKIVAYTYLLMGGEYLWVSRIYTSLFWIIGGIALFALARRMLAPPEPGVRRSAVPAGAVLALAYYLFLPFAVQASRSFQPDPGMVMWIILTAYALYRWAEQPSWKWALLAGLLGGIAVLVKIPAAYIVAGASVVLVLYTLGIKRFWRSPQVWVMVILMVLPSAIYYLGIRQGRASDYFENWTLALSHLLLEPAFYVRWFSFVQNLVGFAAIILSLIGVLIASSRSRMLLLGLWGGYLVYGLSLPYQMYTHSYYHLQLVPIIALSLAPVGQLIFDRIRQQGKVWQALFVAVIVIAAVFQVWVARSTIAQVNYRKEPAYWQEIGSKLPTDGKIIAVTQDYGYRLMYYGWRKVTLWPNVGEQTLAALRGKSKAFEDYFAKHTENKNYFLVTAFGQLNSQPDLKQTLYDQYPIVSQGDGYVIFDLAHPK